MPGPVLPEDRFTTSRARPLFRSYACQFLSVPKRPSACSSSYRSYDSAFVPLEIGGPERRSEAKKEGSRKLSRSGIRLMRAFKAAAYRKKRPGAVRRSGRRVLSRFREKIRLPGALHLAHYARRIRNSVHEVDNRGPPRDRVLASLCEREPIRDATRV